MFRNKNIYKTIYKKIIFKLKLISLCLEIKIYSYIYMSKTWNNQHNKLYNMLYNFIIKQDNTINKSSFIIDMKENLLNIIEDSNYSNSTKEGILFMIARYLEINTTDDKNIQLFKEAGYKYLQIIKNIENQNEQDEKEIENYRPHNYFIDILNSINVDNIQTKIGHYQYLLLALLSYQPPLRTNFYISAKIIKNMKENDKINNFIWISRNNSVHYIVNNDKVSNTKIYETNKNLSYINIEDNKLCKLVIDNYEKYPRQYLFEIDGKPITQQTYLNWLRKISNVKQINNDIMRSSYVNWFYSNKDITFKQKEQLAHQMRHSILTSQKNYLKVLSDENILCTKQPNNDELMTIDNKKYNKNRCDILYSLNIKKVSPRETTLQKYNITYNSIDKNYE